MSNDSNLENVFTKVSYKRKSRNKTKTKKGTHFALINSPESLPFDRESNIRRINEAKVELLTTDLYQSVSALLREGLNTLENPKISRIVCFGLGRISELTVPRYQLTLLLCLKELFEVEVSVSDPIFNVNDINLLRHFHIQIESDNCEGKYCVSDKSITLFYLPHCPKQLMNNLLWANWGLKLNKCIIIGNSINKVIDDNNNKYLARSAEYLSKICPYVLELGIVNSFRLFEVFNDTSIHFFPLNRFKLLSPDFWELHNEPKYCDDDIEIIRKGFENKLAL